MGRLTRWPFELLEYDFEVVHRKGEMHHVPNALSRFYEKQEDFQLVVMERVKYE